MTYVNRDYEGRFWHLLSTSSMLFPAPQPPFPNSKTTLSNSNYASFFVCFSLIFATFMVDYLIFKLIIWQFQFKFVSLPQIT